MKMKHLLIIMLAVLTICSGCQREEKKVDLDKSLRLQVKLNGKYGYCDRGGLTVIPAQFDSASIFSEGLAGVRVNGKDGYIDVKGKMVIPPTFDAASIFLNGRAPVQRGGKWDLRYSWHPGGAGNRAVCPVWYRRERA